MYNKIEQVLLREGKVRDALLSALTAPVTAASSSFSPFSLNNYTENLSGNSLANMINLSTNVRYNAQSVNNSLPIDFRNLKLSNTCGSSLQALSDLSTEAAAIVTKLLDHAISEHDYGVSSATTTSSSTATTSSSTATGGGSAVNNNFSSSSSSAELDEKKQSLSAVVALLTSHSYQQSPKYDIHGKMTASGSTVHSNGTSSTIRQKRSAFSTLASVTALLEFPSPGRLISRRPFHRLRYSALKVDDDSNNNNTNNIFKQQQKYGYRIYMCCIIIQIFTCCCCCPILWVRVLCI
jgi:hypothetical protein